MTQKILWCEYGNSKCRKSKLNLKLKHFLKKLPEGKGKLKKAAINNVNNKVLIVYWSDIFEGN